MLRSHLLQLIAAGSAKGIGNCEKRDVLLLELGSLEQDLFGGDVVVGRGLEDPFLHRVCDLDPSGAGDKRDLLLLGDGDDRHGFAGGAGADDGCDPVVFDQLVGELNGLRDVAAGVVDHQFDLGAVDATFSVDLFHQQFQRVFLRFAQESCGTGHGEQAADFDRRRGKCDTGAAQKHHDAEYHQNLSHLPPSKKVSVEPLQKQCA